MSNLNKAELLKELKRDEGVRNTVYLDSVGIETIGIGRNLVDRGLSDDEIEYLAMNDIEIAERDAKSLVENYESLSDARKRVLINMAFNLGRNRLSKFKKFIAALNVHDYDTAAVEMLDSRWAKQVGVRADRLSLMMRGG